MPWCLRDGIPVLAGIPFYSGLGFNKNVTCPPAGFLVVTRCSLCPVDLGHGDL